MAIRTWVGRFCVSGGHVEEEGPWLNSLIRQRPDDEPDELYVLVEPAGPDSADYASQLVDVIAQLYSKDPLSLTGALTRSLRAAHEHLREWNRKSLKEHQVGAGASCLALRGTEAYVAQVGPSVAYVLNARAEFRRVAPEDASFDQALGVAEEFEPHVTRIALEPGDLVLLASTHAERIAPVDHIRRLLEHGADDALPELYLLLKDEPNTAIVMLSCFEEQTEAPPDYLTRDGGDGSRENEIPLDDQPPASAQSELVGAGVGGDAPQTASATLAFDPPMRMSPRSIKEAVTEITASTAPPPTTGVRLRGDSSTPRYRKSSNPLAMPQVRVPKLAVFAVAAIVLLGLVAWWQLPGSVEENREERFVALIADARQDNARAQATSDRGLKRQLLTSAQSKLDDAEKIHADNGELLALKADVAAARGVLDAVYEVRDFSVIVDLAQQVTGELSVTTTVTGGGNAFLLDARGGRVLRAPLDGSIAPETILEEGEPAGFVTAARPVHIAWSEETQALVILDDARNAFAYFPDRGALPLTVRGTDGWGSLDGIAAAAGNLYVLDVDQGQVWRYLPGQGGFDSERTALIDPADLTGATALAVGADVYVLDDDGGIRRFTGKTETQFPLAGIDRPLMAAASLSVLPGSGRIVVADRGNKRIVVATPEGAFLRQIVSPSFTDLRAVSVDEGTGTLYVLNGDTLLKAPFPP